MAAAEAREFARRFAAHIAAPPMRSLPGATVVRWDSERSAVVEADGQRRVVDSTAPIGVRRKEGGFDRVDLGFERRGDEFGPVVGTMPASVGEQLGGGIRLGPNATVLTPSGDGDVPGEVVGGTVVYANARADTDVAVRLQPFGAELFDVLRSEDSPESWSLSLSDDAAFVADADGAFRVVENGIPRARAESRYG